MSPGVHSYQATSDKNELTGHKKAAKSDDLAAFFVSWLTDRRGYFLSIESMRMMAPTVKYENLGP